SKLAVDQAGIQLEAAKQDLILRVTKAYFDVLSAEENVAVSQAQTRAFSESLERAKLTFKVGTATKTDMLEAQARYDIAAASEIAAKNQLAVANQTLAIITGELSGSLQKISSKAHLPEITPKDMKNWVDTADTNNPQLKLAKLGVDISNLEVSKQKGDRIPTLDLVASAQQNKGYQSFIDSNMTSTNLSLSLQLSVPIYTGGLMSSHIREAEANRLQQKQMQENTKRQVELQTQQAYLNTLNGKQQVDALQQALISNESALEATKKGVEVGVRTNLDLLDAQQQYFATQRDFTVAKYNYLLSVLQLKAAAGTLAENDVKDLNNLLVNQ
ncbi:MAG: TolC family outer membrane protein, partial [Gammaproteobacteria bacterium]|nr:TolC family outer membrane protein [Gammaproteobacteria bacterium]